MSVAEILDYTYDDYAQWEGEWELIDGVPVSMALAPMRIHQNIATEILFALKSTLDEEACPECVLFYGNDWKVNEITVVRPDIVLACDDEHEAYLTKAPKIIVEVLSPATAKKDETVQYYILVYPNDLKAKVYSLKEGKYIKAEDYTREVLTFDDLACNIALDFSKVFQKFRKSA